jgi:hypothetical protein
MATTRGRASVDALFATAQEKLERVLRGAGRAGGKVIADEAKDRTTSEEVREDIRIRARASDGRIVVTIDVKPGWGRSVGTWLEYGTSGHYITVDDSQRQGMTASRINRVGKAGTLVINGKPVGSTVWHPGARPHPFLRPALDVKERDAIAKAQSYINARVVRGGINAAGDEGDDA